MLSSSELDDLFTEALLESTSTEIELLSTPFGDIPHSDGMLAFQLKHKPLFIEIVGMDEEMEDPLKRLIFFEKCKDKYPNEPFLENGIAECYEALERQEEYEQKVRENFELFKGHPSIDLSYVRLKNEEDEAITFHDLYGDELNIADTYPKFKAFDEVVICDFYTKAASYYERKKAYKTAKKCSEVVSIFEPEMASSMSMLIDMRSDPKKRRRAIFKVVLLLLFVLLVLVGIIWAIIKLFQWIF